MRADTSEIRGTLIRASEKLAHLAGVLDAESRAADPDVHRVIESYLAVRKALSDQLSALAVRTIVDEPVVIDETISAIEAAMADTFASQVPRRLLKVRGYRGVHGVLLEYLVLHAESPVPGSLLRLLTGDQVHTERRLRELRDLGYAVKADKVSDDDVYVIDPVPDIHSAAHTQIRSNIKADRKLSESEKVAMLAATTA
jgi:hypothetical protein